MTNELEDKIFTVIEAAKYAHVTRQAIYVAFYKGKLKASKYKNTLRIKKSDLDEYRLNKYNKQIIKHEGYSVYDFEKGHFSVQHVAQVLSEMLRRFYNPQKIYYMLRTGQLRGFKKGYSWVISREDAIALYENEKASEAQVDDRQLRLF